MLHHTESMYGRIQGRKGSEGEETIQVPAARKLSESARDDRTEMSADMQPVVRKRSQPIMPDHMKKVAITGHGKMANTLFYVLDQHRPLAAIISDICDKWTLAVPEDYALQFSEANRQTYITEHNRAEINNGNVLQLTDSPSKSAQNIVTKLKEGSREEKVESLRKLSSLSSDVTFAQEYINKNGLKIIIDFVVSGQRFSGDPLMYILKSFVCLMEHSVVSWDILEPDFTKQVVECLSGSSSRNSSCLQPALEILESVILHSSDCSKHTAILHSLTPDKVIEYLQTQQSDVQKSAIALINAMFMKATAEKKQKIADSLHSKTFRQLITNSVLEARHSVGHEMAHQLYVLQTLMLNLYEDRLQAGVDSHDHAQVANVNKQIEELRRIAFDFTDLSDPNAVPSRKSTVARDYKKLGFTNQANPALELEKSPPGLLALENMMHFAQVHKESYIRVVLENSGRADEHDCPFAQASVKLTTILCELLKIGHPPYDEEQSYYPMFFTVDKPLEEFFSICIQLLNRTWRDMRASKEDFPKVLSVVKEQILRALDKNKMPKTFEQFKTRLGQLAYGDIKKIWDAERQQKDESEAQAKPIQELRKSIKPEILQLIRQHRLNYMEKGTRFPKYDSKGVRTKHKYQCWRLSPNHKALHYGDCTESGLPTVEQLQNKVPVIEIKQLIVGKDCPHVKSKQKFQPTLAFAITAESPSPEEPEVTYHFMANDEYELFVWVDGLNTLLNKPMDSKQTTKDLETLLNMEIKLRLLETEGITIPKDPPPIPPLPDNFNFVYPTA